MDEPFTAAIGALAEMPAGAGQAATIRRAVRLGSAVLAGPRRAALRRMSSASVEDAEQSAIAEFFLKPLARITPASAPALLRTIFRRRLTDQRRRERRYVLCLEDKAAGRGRPDASA